MPDGLGSGIEEEQPRFAPASAFPLARRPGAGSSARGEFLRAVPILAGLSQRLRHAIATRSTWVHVRAGEWLFRQGDEADGLYVVRSGRLEVIFERPEPTVARLLSRGSVVGELALLTREPRSASVRARRDSELLKLASADFAALLSHEPKFALALMRELGHRLQESRSVEELEQPLPCTIALVTPDGAPARELATQVRDALTPLESVAMLEGSKGNDAPAFGAALDRAERAHERVLLVAQGSGAWRSFCLRQADRVLLYAGDRPPPSTIDSPLHGCDLVLRGPARPALVRAWTDAVHPRAIHVLDWGAGSGQGVSRLARRLAGRAVGVVLSSGGARGFAHIGVLEELIAAGVVIDRIGGCSMGAFVGAMFARGLTPAEVHARCREEFVLRRPLSDYALPTTSLLRGRRARTMLARSLGTSTAIEELAREFYCVSCDLVSGQQVVHRRGSLLEAVGASVCLPGVFAPIPRDGALLVDGGLLDSLPVGPMAAAPEGPIIAVDVGRQFTPPGARGRSMRRSRLDVVGTSAPLPPLKETLARSMVLGSIDAAEAARARADVVIEPNTGACGMLEFKRLDEMVEIGRRAARDALSGLPMQCLGRNGPPEAQ